MTQITDISRGGNRLKSRPMRTLIVAIFSLFLLPGAAHAVQPASLPVALLDVSSSKSALRASGVKLRPTGKAVYKFEKLGFTISDVAVGGAARGSFVLKDGFRIVKGKRGVSVRGMLVAVKGRDVSVTGKIGGKRRTIFIGRSPAMPAIDGGRIALATSGAKLSLTKQASAVIRQTIKSYKPKSHGVGTFEGSAYVIAPPPGGGGTIDPGRSKECNAPIAGASTDLPKPIGAVDVDCGFFTWAPRSSFIDYLEINTPIDPAQSLPPIQGSEHYCVVDKADVADTYYFSLPITAGWWDAATSTGDLRLAGGVAFKYQSHGLDITVSDLDVRFDGANSEIWATVVHGGAPSGERIKFVTFDAGVVRAGGPVGPSVAMTRLDTVFTPHVADDVLLGFYSSNPAGGCFDVGFNF